MSNENGLNLQPVVHVTHVCTQYQFCGVGQFPLNIKTHEGLSEEIEEIVVDEKKSNNIILTTSHKIKFSFLVLLCKLEYHAKTNIQMVI